MKQKKTTSLIMPVLSALFAASIAIGAYIIIPFNPVPFVLSNFFVLLAALFLGSKWGLVSVGLYLLCGTMGLPVFSKGGAGIAHLLGPGGGYLFGFLPAVWAGGFISERGGYSMIKSIPAATVATLLIYVCGIPWLKVQTGMTWGNALIAGMLPYLFFDSIKAGAAVAARKALNPVWSHFMKKDEDD